MYTEFNQIFLLNMSNSEFFLIKADQEGVEFDMLKRLHHENDVIASHQKQSELRQQVTAEVKNGDKCNDKIPSVKLPELGEFEPADDDDGFKTPTSLDHKLPVITECPPAPRKLKPISSSTKRKSVSSSKVSRTLRLDLTQEVESLLPKPVFDDLHRKIKKARRENNENE